MAFRYYSVPNDDLSMHIHLIGCETRPEKAAWSKKNGFYVIHYVMSGKGTFNGKSVSAGQGFYLPLGADRNYFPDSEDPWSYLWFDFDGSCCEKFLSSLGFFDEACVFDIPKFHELKSFVTQLNDQFPFSGDSSRRAFISQCLAKSHFYKVMSFHEPNYNSSADIIPDYVLAAENFITDNLGENIKISDVARHINISPKYLYRLFVEYFNISPKQYIINARVAHSIELLSNPALSVSRVAYMCGFSDSMHFSAFFKKNVGISPTQFRKSKFNEE